MLSNIEQPRFLKRLLVATDGSASGERAVAYAIALAKRDGIELTFCDAVDRDGAIIACCSLQGESALMMPMIDIIVDNAASNVAQARDLATAAGVIATTQVPFGRSVAAILDCENDHRFDAIVIGTEDRVGVERLFSGSTADGILRRSKIPVFVIPPDAEIDATAPKRILVAVDDSDPSDAASTFAIEFAAGEHAQLTICSIAETSTVLLNSAYFAFDPTAALRDIRDAAQNEVAVVCDRARAHGVVCERSLVDGDPADAILQLAIDKRADLIVVGTHGRRGIRHWILGSVAESVVHRSHVPVVVVRAPKERTMSHKNGRAGDFKGD